MPINEETEVAPDEPDGGSNGLGSQSASFEVSIPSEAGRQLAATFFPARTDGAPVVVLMHWGRGSMADWVAIAPWLQNSGDEEARRSVLARPANQGDSPWLDPVWFPALNAELDLNVLAFDFTGFGHSLGSGSPAIWLEDAQAALVFATAQEGVDASRLIVLGGSLGSDGAVDACHLFNQQNRAGECIAAFALSPGNYLTQEFTFNEAVQILGDAGTIVYCLAAEEDQESGKICTEPKHNNYHAYVYAGNAHAMMLVDPTFSPIEPPSEQNTLEILVDFLEAALGFPVGK
jgi:dienelactone hydrolase